MKATQENLANLKIGQRLPPISLASSEGRRVALTDYRGRRNLVVVFVGEMKGEVARELLADLARHNAAFAEEEAQVLAVARASGQEAEEIKGRLALPFPVLADEEGEAHRACGARTLGEMVTCVTDRFGEIFAVYRSGEGQPRPTAEELLAWLRFIGIQCPECGVSEWPR